MSAGGLSDWIAGQIVDIELESSATGPGIDGRFRSGALVSKTVNG